jgi:hypothetical protein
MKAFPNKIQTGTDLNRNPTYCGEDGMDLRDYFAAKAMQAIIGNSDQASLEVGEVDNWVGDYAYVVADAMMEARERK